MNSFLSADILLPRNTDYHKWSVIACDQFTSDPEYWKRVRETAGDAPSAINLILPEAALNTPEEEEQTRLINHTMKRYMDEGLFATYPHAYVYVERTLENGSIRKGLVGMVDLEQYDYHIGAVSDIRATEKTVLERIPPRMRVRRNASIELPHILMLCDDDRKLLIEPVAEKKNSFEKIYDFDLMEQGGHISGWLLSDDEAAAFDERLTDYSRRLPDKYRGLSGTPMTFAVGDGNHSLATAKSCYEELKANHPGEDFSGHPARFALVELENIHDEALVFEPIHRILKNVSSEELLTALQAVCADDGYRIDWYTETQQGTIYLDKTRGQLAVGILQSFLDSYLAEHSGVIDYIHDDEELIRLAKEPESIGFILPAMEKGQLFRGVIAEGVLPRKTFSMGHAREKRYYLEGRMIK